MKTTKIFVSFVALWLIIIPQLSNAHLFNLKSTILSLDALKLHFGKSRNKPLHPLSLLPASLMIYSICFLAIAKFLTPFQPEVKFLDSNSQV
jgi:hypothetical protein